MDSLARSASRRCYDARLRVIPLGARGLFLSLEHELAQMPDCAFCMGQRAATVAEIALLVSAPEAEVEAYLPILLEVQLLCRRMTDGALMLPGDCQDSQATAARRNGARGGRPRQGETSDEARLRRTQGHLKLPIPGGLSKTQETQAKPSAETQANPHGTTTSLNKVPSQSEVDELGAELTKLARLDADRASLSFAPIRRWLVDGISPSVIREAVRCVADRGNYSPSNIYSFDYFNKAVRETRVVISRQEDPASKESADQWEAYIAGGCIGPRPRQAA
jgi:hypothetical protein